MKKIYIIYTSVIVFPIVVLVGIILAINAYLTNKTPSTAATSHVSQISTPTPATGLSMQLVPSGTELKTGSPVHVQISAASAEHLISGYDLIISYDKTALTLQSAISLVPSFSLFKLEKPSATTITGVLSLGQKNGIVLNDTPIVNLIFIPKTKGTQSIQMSASLGKLKTQLVDQETRVFSPRLGNVTLAIH
ncbi:hypothetical protein HGA88_06485 [Candidatus Roizmanbacteria bacterium]|nr:hypothetical protein [Candidatus Roizmanbacteria bacterium]